MERNHQCAPITTFSQSRLRESCLKPTLHKPPFRSVRFSRVHLPVLLYVYLPACVVALAFAILGTIFAPIYRSAIYGCRYLCIDVGASPPKILAGRYLRRYLSQLNTFQENKIFWKRKGSMCRVIFTFPIYRVRVNYIADESCFATRIFLTRNIDVSSIFDIVQAFVSSMIQTLHKLINLKFFLLRIHIYTMM